MEKAMEVLVGKTDLSFCVECGKCVSACPMAEIFEDFSYGVSPRGIVEKVLFELDVLEDIGLWFCLTCEVCTQICPAGVRYRDFIEGARLLAIEKGVKERGVFCQVCGSYFLPVHTLEHLKEKSGGTGNRYLTVCPKCRPYDFGERLKAKPPRRRRMRS